MNGVFGEERTHRRPVKVVNICSFICLFFWKSPTAEQEGTRANTNGAGCPLAQSVPSNNSKVIPAFILSGFFAIVAAKQ